MAFRLSRRSISRLNGVHPVLFKIIKGAIEHEKCPFDFAIPRDGGRRTASRQMYLYSQGRTTLELEEKGIFGVEGIPSKKRITWTLNSNHMPKEDGFGHAFDIFAYVNKKASWDRKYLEPIARHLQWYAKEFHDTDLQWGYDLWKKDAAHFQLPE